MGGLLRRALQTLIHRVLWAAPIAAGVTAVGLALVVGVLDAAVNQPQSFGDLVLLPDLGVTIAVGAVFTLGFGALELYLRHREHDALIAVSVGIALIASAVIFVGLIVLAAWVLSLLGVRGGVPESIGAAWLTLGLIALVVAVTLWLTLTYSMRWIARVRNDVDDSVPVSVFVAALLVVALPVAVRNPPSADEQLRSTPPPDPVLIAAQTTAVAPAPPPEVALVTRYRPFLYFDSTERWRPLDVDAYLAEKDATVSAHEFCSARKVATRIVGYDCHALNDPRELPRASLDPDAALHLDANHTDAEKLAGEQSAPSRIYYHLSRDGTHTYVDYWVFYRFNDSPNFGSLTCLAGLSISEGTCFDHEGDWEGITVTLPADTTGDQPPQFVTYAGHKWRYRYAWSALAAAGSTDGVHPKVWVARGSHASYPLPCGRARSCHQLHSDLPDGRRDGAISWVANVDATCHKTRCVGRLPISATGGPASWEAFAGVWGLPRCTVGLRLCVRSEGPHSPYFQTRYKSPGAGTPDTLPR